MFRVVLKRMTGSVGAALKARQQAMPSSLFVRGVKSGMTRETTVRVLTKLGRSVSTVVGVTTVGMVAYELYKSNVKEVVIGPSVLEKSNQESINVVDLGKLTYVNQNVESGRSGARLVQDEHGKKYYLKATFNRQFLLNELFAGALARWLLGDKAPGVYLVEEKMSDHQAKFMFMSESLGDRNMNMEDWAKDGATIDPKHLGVFLALDFFIGDSDSKLANLVIITSGEKAGHCYCIDHEKSFNLQVKTLADAEVALEGIGEFHMKKSLSDRLLEQEEGAGLDVNQDNLRQPLKGNDRIKSMIKPKLLAHIQEDIDDGCVKKLYEAIDSLTKSDLEEMIRPFGSFVQPQEKAEFIKCILERQKELKTMLSSHDQLASRRPGL